MSRTYTRDRFTWLAYLFLAFYGYFLNAFGPITPFLMDDLGLSYTVSSLHFTAFAVGILVVGLGGHLLIRRIGRWWCLWIGAFGMSLGALLLVLGKTPVITIGAAFLMGVIGSLILAIIPAALADHHGELRAVALSEANVLASAVSTMAPLLVGWCAGFLGNWRLALVLGASASILMYLGFRKAAPPASAASQPTSTAARRPLPRLYWIYWVALVLGVAVEFCMIFWSANYVEVALGASKASAAQAVSVFLGAMIVGRLLASRLVLRFATRRLVVAAFLIASAGFLLYWGAPSILLGLTGLFFTGLGVAFFYPLIFSLAIEAAGEATIQAGARATLASGVAILVLPLVLGRLADAVGIRSAYGVVLLLLAGVFVIIQFAGRPAAADVAPISN